MKSNGNNESRMNFLRRTAKEVRTYRVTMKILAAALASVTALVAVLYVTSALYQNSGAFTVNLNKSEMTEYGLSLSETRDMKYKTSYLNANIIENMTNITATDIPDTVGMRDGEDNGENYIAYTFYLQNTGKQTVSYEYTLELSNTSNNLDEAIRVRVYVDGEPTTYGKTGVNGKKEADVDESFYSSTEVLKRQFEDFAPNEQTKFTVVVWIEGNDPECLDFVLGGQIKLEMKMRILDEKVQK